MKVTKIRIGLVALIICSITGLIIVYKNIPLRTAIYRSFAQGNSFLISESDTLYGFGYYGVRKWLVDDDKPQLLARNDKFMENCFIGHLVGRSGVINGDYLYVAARSYLGGSDEMDSNGYLNGKLMIMRKVDLSIVKEINSDIKLNEAKIHEKYLIVSGLCGFDIYHIVTPDSVNPVYKYRSAKFTEFQGLEVFDTDSSTYIAFARFAEGISIWNMTKPDQTYPIVNIPIQNLLKNTMLSKGLQVFKVKLNYPYLYATFAPMSGYFEKEEDRRGVLVCDLSNIAEIRTNIGYIPKKYFYSTKIGDPEPTHLDIYKNKLYVNWGEKGVAVFDLTNPFKPKFQYIKDMNNKGNMILPIHINYKGFMFLGDYCGADIYKNSIN